MIKSSSRAAIVLSASAIALTAAMLPAQAATSGWRVNAELATRGSVSRPVGSRRGERPRRVGDRRRAE